MSTQPTPTEFEVLDRADAYKGFFRITRYTLRHALFRGGMSEDFTREVFVRGTAVAVLLYDPDQDKVVLVEQFRVGAMAADEQPWMLEVVAGILDEGEEPEDVARREAHEEAGCTVKALVPITRFLPSAGGSNEVISLFCGQVDSDGIGGVHGLAEENEDIRVLVTSADEAIAWLDTDRYRNAMTIIALSWLARKRDELRRAWVKSPQPGT